MGERKTFVLHFPPDAVEVDEDLGCVVIRLDAEQLGRLIRHLEAERDGLETVTVGAAGAG